MKLNKKTLATTGIILASMFLGACGGNNDTSVSGIYQIEYKKDIGAVQVNTTIDLDNYLTLIRQDKSKDNDYTITSDDASVKVDGHKVTPTKIGTYTIHLVDERVAYDRKITIDSRSEDNITVINFFDKIAETPNHYEIDLLNFNDAGTGFDYAEFSYFHTPNYSAAFNLANPGKIYEGDPTSFILAMLQNELGEQNGFQGYFDAKGTPTFYPGALANYSYYYINMDLPVDGYAFTSQIEAGEDGEEYETLVADATFTENLLLYGCSSRFPATYKTEKGVTYSLEVGGTILLGMGDSDLDDVIDSLYLYPYAYATNVNNPNDVQMFGFYPLRIGEAGTARVSTLEKAIEDPSYYPKKIESPDITTAFENVAKTNNYTVLMNFAPSGSSTTFYELLFGKGSTTPISVTNTITQDGILMKETEGDTTILGGYFNRDGNVYQIRTLPNETTGKPETTTALLPEIKDVWSVEGIDSLTAKAVTSASVDSTIWRTRKEDTANKTITYTGMIGDDDGAGNKDNGLFQELFDQFGLLSWNGYRFGSLLTEANTLLIEAAATTSSDYTSFVINTETNEITVKAQLYFPVEGYSGSYIDCTYTISNIGTTTNDFSSFTVANA